MVIERGVGLRAIAQRVGFGEGQGGGEGLRAVQRDGVDGKIGHVTKHEQRRVDFRRLAFPFRRHGLGEGAGGHNLRPSTLGADWAGIEEDSPAVSLLSDACCLVETLHFC